jgi:hypothetical protein
LNQPKYPVVPVLILALLALLPASAGAVVRSTPGGPASYLPLQEAAASPATAPLGTTVPTGSPPLEWNGGPVMPSHEAFAIFWAPSGFSFPAGYEAAITEYLEDVAADSGLSTNVYSVSAQYTGSNGRATYTDSFGGSVDDTDAYPSSGTCAGYTGLHGASYTACVSDAKIKAEVQTVAAANSWPTGLGAEYYVVLPPQVGSCFGTSAASGCFDKEFCAYHSFVSSPKLIYANISYSPEDPTGCGVGEYPNGHANGNVDDTLSSLSHEANESITDPELNAWFDEEGFENGDECRNTPGEEDYGPPLGGAAGSLFNESIHGAHYYLQQEWSNDIADCAQRVGPATPLIANPGPVAPGQTVQFNGSGSVPGDGGIKSYEWEFGDGAIGFGPTPSHSYAAVGSFTVTLTVTDDAGYEFSASRQVAVAVPGETLAGPTPVQPKPTGTAVAAAKAKVKHGVASLTLRCRGGGPCAGIAKLIDHGAIGHAAFKIAAGKRLVLHIKLTRAGITLLEGANGSLKVRLAGTGVQARRLLLVSSR